MTLIYLTSNILRHRNLRPPLPPLNILTSFMDGPLPGNSWSAKLMLKLFFCMPQLLTPWLKKLTLIYLTQILEIKTFYQYFAQFTFLVPYKFTKKLQISLFAYPNLHGEKICLHCLTTWYHSRHSLKDIYTKFGERNDDFAWWKKVELLIHFKFMDKSL